MRWRVGVVVPARNEARTIDACLASIRVAVDAAASLVDRVEIVVVADSCDDDTISLAGAHDGVHVHEVGHASVGRSRSIGSHLAVARLGGPLERIWLANTDADSTVTPSWIARQLAAADCGVVGVAGIVALDGATEQLLESFEQMYSVGIDATAHPHVHATNLGVRADALRSVGGWSPIATGEDHDLWDRLRDGGLSCVADPALVVSTSARRAGRAPAGFASVMAALAAPIAAGGP